VNTAAFITETVCRTVVYLAGIGAGLRLLLAFAPRVTVSKAPAPVREPAAVPVPSADGQGTAVTAGGAS
jgi:hypothetical protein